ncbi:hypothetical protein TTHERM_00730330 (macronuclear) [Tetrahymena thermophila SB210]|uniref:Uncharacterized protein n=1 Tax=Tetrahymena thermophila (strain SB210) TaxID=312017 RepID=Q245I0_TETTS|nr:hypothetical protein TTHERM_00730330 [Tetrahymena thermophila SB210]EAS03384.2 hypothetical protein TTHERM_00730330 [Tetrahymena thermophila SB210]|eukprot:XP_001023629.2 hypothetical protein TTHERM_00730330 [Tetrahymena thermophila SB210]
MIYQFLILKINQQSKNKVKLNFLSPRAKQNSNNQMLLNKQVFTKINIKSYSEVDYISKEYQKFMKKCYLDHKIKDKKQRAKKGLLKQLKCRKSDHRNSKYTYITVSHMQKCGLCLKKFRELIAAIKKYKKLAFSFVSIKKKFQLRLEKYIEILQLLKQ